MGIDDPAARLAVRGSGAVALGPGCEVRSRVAVPVRGKTTTTTAEGSLGQSDRLAQHLALRAGLGGREPTVASDQFSSKPGCLVAELAAKLRPGGITDCAGEPLVPGEVGDGEVLDGQPGVGLDKLARDLVKKASPQVSNASVLFGQASAGLDTVWYVTKPSSTAGAGQAGGRAVWMLARVRPPSGQTWRPPRRQRALDRSRRSRDIHWWSAGDDSGRGGSLERGR